MLGPEVLGPGSGTGACPTADTPLLHGSPEAPSPGPSAAARARRPLVPQLAVLSLRAPSGGPAGRAANARSSLTRLLLRGPSEASERPLSRKSISPGLGVLAPCRLPLPVLVACRAPGNQCVP